MIFFVGASKQKLSEIDQHCFFVDIDALTGGNLKTEERCCVQTEACTVNGPKFDHQRVRNVFNLLSNNNVHYTPTGEEHSKEEKKKS